MRSAPPTEPAVPGVCPIKSSCARPSSHPKPPAATTTTAHPGLYGGGGHSGCWASARQFHLELEKHGAAHCARQRRAGGAQTNYEANDWQPGYDGSTRWREWREKETPQIFDALLWMDNVKGTAWLLKTLANEFKRMRRYGVDGILGISLYVDRELTYGIHRFRSS